MDKFENWFNKINEDLNEPTIATEIESGSDVEVSTAEDPSPRIDMLNDVDTIMHSLETLAGELTEDLEINENGMAYLGVAGAAIVGALGFAGKKLYDYTVVAPKARKAQSKVNAMSIKIAGIESSMSSAEPEQKDKLQLKIDKAKEQRDELQNVIDGRYSDAPNSVKKALSSEKSKGKLEALKVIMGDSSPEQQAKIKDQIKKLKDSIQQADADFAAEKPEENEEAAQEVQTAIDKNQESDKESDDTQDDDQSKKDAKEAKLKKLDDLLKRVQDSDAADKDNKIERIKALKDKIEAKESWQISNDTTLGILLEMEIKKLEMEFMLNENKSNSIIDRFSKLI